MGVLGGGGSIENRKVVFCAGIGVLRVVKLDFWCVVYRVIWGLLYLVWRGVMLECWRRYLA